MPSHSVGNLGLGFARVQRSARRESSARLRALDVNAQGLRWASFAMTPRALGLFIVVGSIGFMLDAGTTEGLVAGGLQPLVARVAAVATAVPATFFLNPAVHFPVAG